MRDNMILDYIEVKNFRSYYNVQRIEFATDPIKNFTIIQGNNGTGKTTLLNAFTWCLYDDELHDDTNGKNMSLCNNLTASELNIGDSVDVSVELGFHMENKYGEKDTWIIRRIKTFNKKQDSNSPKSYTLMKDVFGDYLEIISTPYGESSKIYDSENHDLELLEMDIDRRIPKAMQNYFFFNGETLQGYFDASNKASIDNSVHNLSQLNLLENMSNHLNTVKNKYNDEIKRINKNPDLDLIINDITNYSNKITNLKENLDYAKEQKRISEDNINTLEKKLRYSDNKNVSELQNKIQQYKNRAKNTEEILQNQRISFDNQVLKMYPKVMLFDVLINALNHYEEGREKGKYPSQYQKSLLNDLLDMKTCLCGSNLSEGSEYRDKIQDLYNNTSDLTDMEDVVIEEAVNLKNYLSDIKTFKNSIIPLKSSIRENNNTLIEYKDLLKKTQEELDNCDIKAIKNINESLKDSEEDKKKFENEIMRFESDIRRYKEKLNKRETERAKFKNDNYNIRKLEKKVSFCKEASEKANNILKILQKELSHQIENHTKKQFKEISWKDDEFVDVKIDDEYNVLITNKSGDEEKPGDLSAGEQLVLALSFMMAIHSISGYDLPMIVDTPLGKLDKDMRLNVAEQLPKFTKNKQVTLVVTSTEYESYFRDALKNHVGKEYKIRFDSTDIGKKSTVGSYD